MEVSLLCISWPRSRCGQACTPRGSWEAFIVLPFPSLHLGLVAPSTLRASSGVQSFSCGCSLTRAPAPLYHMRGPLGSSPLVSGCQPCCPLAASRGQAVGIFGGLPLCLLWSSPRARSGLCQSSQNPGSERSQCWLRWGGSPVGSSQGRCLGPTSCSGWSVPSGDMVGHRCPLTLGHMPWHCCLAAAEQWRPITLPLS